MHNHYPWWKWLIIALVVVPGLFYALPNLFGDDPGIQIRGSRGTSLSSADFNRLASDEKYANTSSPITSVLSKWRKQTARGL